jgi:CRISPR/Cas system CMR subunit Cmr4 (Cas7 group RAMP superfamily)
MKQSLLDLPDQFLQFREGNCIVGSAVRMTNVGSCKSDVMQNCKTIQHTRNVQKKNCWFTERSPTTAVYYGLEFLQEILRAVIELHKDNKIRDSRTSCVQC